MANREQRNKFSKDNGLNSQIHKVTNNGTIVAERAHIAMHHTGSAEKKGSALDNWLVNQIQNPSNARNPVNVYDS